MTEAKTAALQRLAVRSLYSSDPATGTGTDQFAIAAAETGGHRLTSASPHVKFGELIGRDGSRRNPRGASMAERTGAQLHPQHFLRAWALRVEGDNVF